MKTLTIDEMHAKMNVSYFSTSMEVKIKIGKAIATVLRHIRHTRKMNQEQAAFSCGVPVSEWQSLEQMKILDPRISTLLRIAFNFSISLDKVFNLIRPYRTPQGAVPSEAVMNLNDKDFAFIFEEIKVNPS